MIESKRTNIDLQSTNYNTMTESRRTNIDLQSTNYNTMTESRRTNIDLQSTNYKTKDRVTRKIGNELKYSGRVSSSCSTCGTHGVALATKPMIIHE
jgi:hypothetical protein